MIEDRGISERKEEIAAAVKVEEQSAADCPQVCGGTRVTTDQWGAGGMREPSGASRPKVSRGAEDGKSQGGA